MILFVDDMVERWNAFIAARPGVEATHCDNPMTALGVLYMSGDSVTEVWLDHDCGFFTKDHNGTPCCMVENDFRSVAYALAFMEFTGKVYVHSANPSGRAWMINLLKSSGVDAEDRGCRWGE